MVQLVVLVQKVAAVPAASFHFVAEMLVVALLCHAQLVLLALDELHQLLHEFALLFVGN